LVSTGRKKPKNLVSYRESSSRATLLDFCVPDVATPTHVSVNITFVRRIPIFAVEIFPENGLSRTLHFGAKFLQ